MFNQIVKKLSRANNHPFQLIKKNIINNRALLSNIYFQFSSVQALAYILTHKQVFLLFFSYFLLMFFVFCFVSH